MNDCQIYPRTDRYCGCCNKMTGPLLLYYGDGYDVEESAICLSCLHKAVDKLENAELEYTVTPKPVKPKCTPLTELVVHTLRNRPNIEDMLSAYGLTKLGIIPERGTTDE